MLPQKQFDQNVKFILPLVLFITQKLNPMGSRKKMLYIVLFLIGVGIFLFNQEDKFQNLKTKHKFAIYQDEHGIPRIYARDKASAFYALGFSEAQDRLWTLHLRRMIAQGRLSEIFGPEALGLDLENRNMNYYGVGKQNAKGIDEETRNIVQAYCDGINDYAKNVRYLPLQFYLTFTKWEQWKIQDSLTMLAFLSFALQFDWMYQLARQRLLEVVGFDLAWKLMPFGDSNLFRQITIMNSDEIKEQGRYVKYDDRVIEPILKKHWVNRTMPIGSINMPSDYDSLGSNAWVIGGEHTQSGRPLLANDPHLGLLIPSLFYMAEFSLVNEKNQTILTSFGAKAEGLPALSIGINNQFAWGSTAAYIDNKDIFHEVVRDNNGTLEYLFKGKWHAFKKRKQVFNVRGQGQVVKEYYHTHRGPVIEHLFIDIHVKYGFPIPAQYRINHTMTLSSAIFTPDYKSLKGLAGLAFSTSFDQFQNVSSLIETPNIDSVFITQNGTYGYGAVGRIPRRQIPEMGGFVKDGTTDLYDMGQFLSWQQMPKLRNPKKGYISMANNKFAQDSYDTRSSIHELTTGRSYRLHKIITQKIEKKQKFTHQDMINMQLDTRDQFLSEALPPLLNALHSVRYIWENNQTERYFQLLRKWDYFMPSSSIQATIYHVFQHEFHESLLHGTNLTIQQRQAIINHAFFEVYFMKLHERIGNFNLTEQEAVICTNSNTNNFTEVHPCLVNAALAFKKLPDLLENLYGTKDESQYEWGKIHKNVFKAIPWSEIPLLKSIWGRQTPAGGNSRTLNVAILTHQTKSYNSIGGPVFRFVTDLNETYFSYDTGESDRVASKFYDNFLGKDMYVKYQKKNPLKGDKVEWKQLIYRLD